MLVNKSFNYVVDNKSYQVNVTYKRVRNINYRFKDNQFYVSCSRLTLMSSIKSGLDKFARHLIKSSVKKVPVGEDYIYILGNKIYLCFPGTCTFMNESFDYKTMDEFKKKIKKIFLKYLTSRTEYWAKEMKAPKYLVKIRDMKSRYGSNNRAKKSITYAFMLIHHPLDIIDSVIIHELTHCFVFNHSDKFYKLLYVYCPNYNSLRKRLIKTEFN